MDAQGDTYISDFRLFDSKDECQRLRSINLDCHSMRVLRACIHLAKSFNSILYLFTEEPLLYEYFPLYDAVNKRYPRLFVDMSWSSNLVYRPNSTTTDAFLFQACIATEQRKATRYLMRHHGFSVVGTDDQYYEWTQKLEGNTRCYRAVLTILGIAQCRKRAQRDTLGLVAKALWSTCDYQEWEPLLPT